MVFILDFSFSECSKLEIAAFTQRRKNAIKSNRNVLYDKHDGFGNISWLRKSIVHEKIIC